MIFTELILLQLALNSIWTIVSDDDDDVDEVLCLQFNFPTFKVEQFYSRDKFPLSLRAPWEFVLKGGGTGGKREAIATP